MVSCLRRTHRPRSDEARPQPRDSTQRAGRDEAAGKLLSRSSQARKAPRAPGARTVHVRNHTPVMSGTALRHFRGTALRHGTHSLPHSRRTPTAVSGTHRGTHRHVRHPLRHSPYSALACPAPTAAPAAACPAPTSGTGLRSPLRSHVRHPRRHPQPAHHARHPQPHSTPGTALPAPHSTALSAATRAHRDEAQRGERVRSAHLASHPSGAGPHRHLPGEPPSGGRRPTGSRRRRSPEWG